MHSLVQPQSGFVEQGNINNPWGSHSNDRSSSPSTATTTSYLRGDTEPAFQDDAFVSPGRTSWRDLDMILSPSPPPQPAQPIHSQPPLQETDMSQPDPRIASLKAIFPDFDDAVILDVLESADNDHDRALDVLLGMNDPSFVPPSSPPRSTQSPNQLQSDPSFHARRQSSQEALDEQFARMLALEEQQAVAQERAQQDGMGYIMYQPYQAQRGGRGTRGPVGQSQSQPQIQGQGGKDTMAEFQQGFNRIAESGKKTFSSIVSKVKAKMQEFEQGQGWSGQAPPPGQAPQPVSGSYYVPSQQQGKGQGAYAQPSPNPQRQTSESRPAWTSTYSSSPPRSGILRPAATEPVQPTSSQRPSYYDPNSRGYDLYGDDEEIQTVKTIPSTLVPAPAPAVSTPAIAPQPVTARSFTTTSRNDNPATPPPPSESNSSPPSYASPVLSSSSVQPSLGSPPTRSLSPTMTGAKGATPGAPGGVDFSKLGLLPKRPILLVPPQPAPAAGTGADAGVNPARLSIANSESTLASPMDRDRERREPEFVENPFEDRP